MTIKQWIAFYPRILYAWYTYPKKFNTSHRPRFRLVLSMYWNHLWSPIMNKRPSWMLYNIRHWRQLRKFEHKMKATKSS